MRRFPQYEETPAGAPFVHGVHALNFPTLPNVFGTFMPDVTSDTILECELGVRLLIIDKCIICSPEELIQCRGFTEAGIYITAQVAYRRYVPTF